MGDNLKEGCELRLLNVVTNNFSPINLLGKGSYAWVYYAYLLSCEESIVKKLDMTCVEDSDDEFKAQLSAAYELKHEHFTGLTDHYMDEDNRCLFYEYATMGSLHDVLYGRKGLKGAEAGPVLTWAQRAKIAYGAAKGLKYLHETVVPPVVHGDIRSSNVLLFDDFTSKIADFRLTNALTDVTLARSNMTRPVGSCGYDGPEYDTTPQVTEKSDVYSFGVVLLELLTGRKPVDDTLAEEQQNLVTWATPYLSDDKIEQIIDPKLNGDFPPKAVAKVAALAKLCIQNDPDFRPHMSSIVNGLNDGFEPIVDQCEVVKVYSMDELNNATNNFSQTSLVAEDYCDSVYNASFSNGQLGFIKKLDMSIEHDSDADFAAQLLVVSELNHKNLTRLMGYYVDEDSRLLVYEYAIMGSLHDVLYGKKGIEGAEQGPVLTWPQRVKIFCGTAKGLEYLHETVNPPIVHGDVRSSNVLLFDDFTPKVGDFLLTKALTDDTLARINLTRPVGSRGYDGPEYDTTEEKTVKGDVYSFGVLLLELLTGRKPVDETLPEEQQNLVSWATPYLSNDKVEQIVDPKLNGEFPSTDVAKVATLASLCIQDEPDFRPNMSIMVKALEPLQNLPEAAMEAETKNPLHVFSMDDLNDVTDNFSQMSLIAKGPYGHVFQAIYKNGEPVAIKKLDLSNSQDSDTDFAAQLSIVSKRKHEHFTELYGYCLEEDNRILVYELAIRGSLHDVLYGRKHVYGAEPEPTLTWSQRTIIAYGAAKGLEYLHETVDPPIVHGDVRSSNVLVFYDYDSKIGDFHLTNYPKDASTRKSDVFCFGVVLLELLTGRKPVDETLPEEQQDLVTWATPCLNAENVEKIIDPKLNGDFPLEEVAKVAALASQCIQDEPDMRPDMSIVVGVLVTIVNV